VPASTRCPSCSAALAPGASWCSLCHADLRPKIEPARRSQDVVPGTVATATAVPPALVNTPAAPGEGDAAAGAAPDAAPRGRHARVQEPDLEPDLQPEPLPVPAPALRLPGSSSGRHARGRGPAPRSRARSQAPTLPLEPLELDLDGRPLAPEEVDQIADQMLTRLAVTEERPRFFDPDDLPGGKFVFMAGCGFAVLVLLIVLYTVFGLFLGRS